MQLGLIRVRGAEHVTVHVVGGRQRVQPNGVQHLVHRLDVLLQNAVELEGLTVGQTDAAVDRVFTGKLVDRLPLFGGNHPTRQTAAQQHRMTRLQLLLCTLGADVAVVLLVHAVETDQQEVVAFETAGETVIQIFSNGATQIVAFQLHALGVCQFTFDHQWPRMFSLISRHLADNGAQRAAHLKFIRRFGIHTAEFGNHFQQSLLNVFRHAIGVAADINVGTVIDPAPQLCALFAQFVLYVYFFFLVAGRARSMRVSTPSFT